ncbi:MAG: hypothetical protein HMLKMBBP_01387 [Planctomycetes bacterium]|nr:hypothetical protein [Planctomycetota bacterium]
MTHSRRTTLGAWSLVVAGTLAGFSAALPAAADTATFAEARRFGAPPATGAAWSPAQHPGFDVYLPEGAVFHDRTLFDLPGGAHPAPFALSHCPDTDYDGSWGRSWRSSFDSRLEVEPAGDLVFVDPRGGRWRFGAEPGGWTTPIGLRVLAARDGDGYRLTGADRWVRVFDATGRFTSWIRPDGGVIRMKRAPDHRLLAVTTPEKRKITFKYTKELRIASVRDWAKRTWAFRHGETGNLETILRPKRKGDATPVELRYEYDSQGRLTTVRNGRGGFLGTVEYDGNGRAGGIRHPLGDLVFDYGTNTTRITGRGDDPPVVDIEHDADGRITELARVSGGVPVETETFTYDAAGRMLRWELPGGRSRVWTFTDTADPRDGAAATTFELRAADHPATAPLVRTFTFVPGTTQVLTDMEPGGATWTSSYDAAGNLVSLTGPAILTPGGAENPVTTYSYDALNRLVRTVHPDGAEDAYKYGKGKVRRDLVVEKILDAAAGDDPVTGRPRVRHSTRYRYDSAGNVTRIDEGRGAKVRTFAWDAWGAVSSVGLVPTGSVTFEYDADGNPVRTERPLAGPGGRIGSGVAVTEADYDDFGLRTAARVEDGFGGVRETVYEYHHGHLRPSRIVADAEMRIEYDVRGRETRRTEGFGTPEQREFTTTWSDHDGPADEGWAGLERTTFEYDAHGRLAATVHPNGTRAETAYDAAGRRASETETSGGLDRSRTRFEYDAAGNVVEIERDRFVAGGGVTAVETWTKRRTLRGALAEEVDSRGCLMRFVHDGLGRVVRSEDPSLDLATEVVHAPGGGVATHRTVRGGSTPSPVVRETSMEYDAAGRVVRIDDADGATTRLAYDAAGRIAQTRLPGGAVVDRTFDGDGNVVGETQSAGGAALESAFEWGADGRLAGQSAADGRTIAYGRDAHGNVTSASTAGTVTGAWTYDAAGRVTSSVSGAGAPVLYGYGPEGTLAVVTASGGTQTFAWDPLDRLAVATDTVGTTVTVVKSWDSLGNELSDLQDGAGVLREFGNGGRTSRVSVPGGRTYDIERDAVGRVTSVTAAGVTTDYEYVPGTRAVARRTHPRMTSEFGHDGRLRRTSAEHTTAEGVDSRWDATWGERGFIETHLRESGAGEERTYDAFGRMTASRVTGAGGADPLDTEIEYGGPEDRPTAIVTSTDAIGKGPFRSHSVPLSFDARGALVSAGSSNFTYDASLRAADWFENRPAYDAGRRLVAYDPFGRVGSVTVDGGPVLATYRYDALGRPVLAVEQEFTGLTNLTRRRVFDGCRIVQELSPPALPGFDLYYDPDYAGRGHTGSGFADSFSTTYLWQDDATGAPRQLYNATPATGTLQERYDRTDAWGQRHFQTNGGADFRGAPSLQSAANLPGYASSYATGLVFGWSGPTRDPFLPRPLGPDGIPPIGPPGPAPGPNGPPPYHPEPGRVGWLIQPVPDDGADAVICGALLSDLRDALEIMRRAEQRAFECNNRLQSTLDELARLGLAIEEYNRRRDELRDALAAQVGNLESFKALDQAVDTGLLLAGGIGAVTKVAKAGAVAAEIAQQAAATGSRITRRIGDAVGARLVGDAVTDAAASAAGEGLKAAGAEQFGDGLSFLGSVALAGYELAQGQSVEARAAQLEADALAAELGSALSRSDVKAGLQDVRMLLDYKQYLRDGIDGLCAEFEDALAAAQPWIDAAFEKAEQEFRDLKDQVEARIGK